MRKGDLVYWKMTNFLMIIVGRWKGFIICRHYDIDYYIYKDGLVLISKGDFK